MKTEQAKAAKLIKQYLKSKGLKCSVTSDSGSMTSSVNIKLFGVDPDTRKKAEDYCNRFQYGHFDGMTDMYEYSNRNGDLPQAKYVFVENRIDDEMYQKAWDFLRSKYPGNAKDLPEDYYQATRLQWCSQDFNYDDLVEMHVRKIINGFGFGLDKENSDEFWKGLTPDKPTPPKKTGKATIEEHTHTKRGFQMFIVTMPGRVEREEYLRLLDIAKSLGGWYSRKWGTTPAGFAFKDNNKAVEFAGNISEQATDPSREELIKKAIDCQRANISFRVFEKDIDANESGSIWSEAAEIIKEIGPYQWKGYEKKPKQIKKADHSLKLRTLADKMQTQIDNKFADRQTNTPKRLAQANHARLEGERLERTQKALYGLADLHEAGTVPDVLEKITSKTAIYSLMGTKTTPVSNGYHGYSVSTGEANKETPEALALWALLTPKSEEDKQAEETQRKIDGLQFSNIPGYFPTPESVIDTMLSYADIDDKQDILEPSAGNGAIMDKINQTGFNGGQRVAYEINYTLSDIIKERFEKWATYQGDFIEECHPDDFNRFDRIIMNPPFQKWADIKHIQHAIKLLKPGGKLVALCAAGSRQEKELQPLADHWEVLPAGSFKQAGTNVNVALLVISN